MFDDSGLMTLFAVVTQILVEFNEHGNCVEERKIPVDAKSFLCIFQQLLLHLGRPEYQHYSLSISIIPKVSILFPELELRFVATVTTGGRVKFLPIV